MEDFYQDKKQKRIDFVKGILTNLVVGFLTGVVYLGITVFMFFLTNLIELEIVVRIVGVALVAILAVIVFIYEYREIRKHLKDRRYIAIGMIVALVLPLLALGACTPILIEVGWPDIGWL
jgi:cytochrome c biogenesis protein CcdA